MSIEVGIDVGGTFTDIVVRFPDGAESVLKVPSTPADPSEAIMNGLNLAIERLGLRKQGISRLIHGTTVATNAVIERKGARVGLLCTAGFADVIDIGRQSRKELYKLGPLPQVPSFLVPGRRRREVTERVAADGSILTPLDLKTLAAAVHDLVNNEKVDSIAICYLFSFLNDAHEKSSRDEIHKLYPNLSVSLSSEVNPEFREYERTLATGFDAYVKPVLNTYLRNLSRKLDDAGLDCALHIMQSRGGVVSAGVAMKAPVGLFLSGPAGGVVGGNAIAGRAGSPNVVTVDVGGTSSDIAVITNGSPSARREGFVGGFPVRVRMVDVHAIGAGGGSIAWVDGAGGLHVGPQSAGSSPGPACYLRGGTRATVTDASVVLGYIDPDYFAGGELKLDRAAAQHAIESEIGSKLGLSNVATALGIHRVVSAQMCEGIRSVTVHRGLDVRKYSLMPMGGAGALHATALAEELGIRHIIIPPNPGVLSARGLIDAPIERQATRGVHTALSRMDDADLALISAELSGQVMAIMAHEERRGEGIEISHYADMCFAGQSHYIEVPVLAGGKQTRDALYEEFLKIHDRTFGYADRKPAMIGSLHAIGRGWRQVRSTAGAPLTGANNANATPVKGIRRVVMLKAGEIDARVYNRGALIRGIPIQTPCLIEQSDTTILVDDGWSCEVDADKNLILNRILA